MMRLTDRERRRSLPMAVLVVAAVLAAGGSVAFAQVEEPLPTDDSHPAGPEQSDTARSELGKDSGPNTAVLVQMAQEDLPQSYMIQFGDEFDWVRLASGEWLRGNLERMRDGSLSFDSSELKLLTYDWKKVQELHSPRANTYVFTEGD
ncbi:MAG: hypothetical protein JRD92_18575, partial [Deltaproteobacteria bacterium]|nr:hypothetical protein [Deltaproteobacteria bacterium]